MALDDSPQPLSPPQCYLLLYITPNILLLLYVFRMDCNISCILTCFFLVLEKQCYKRFHDSNRKESFVEYIYIYIPPICGYQPLLACLLINVVIYSLAGDPEGDGTGGESIWGGEFEVRFHHCSTLLPMSYSYLSSNVESGTISSIYTNTIMVMVGRASI